MTRLKGWEAIDYASENKLTLNKYADPFEGPREGLTPFEATRVAMEDPSLIYIDIEGRA